MQYDVPKNSSEITNGLVDIDSQIACADNQSPPGGIMRSLLTWNIQGGGKRIPAIMSTLIEHNADVLVLTEYRGTSACRELGSQLSAGGWAYQFSCGLSGSGH